MAVTTVASRSRAVDRAVFAYNLKQAQSKPQHCAACAGRLTHALRYEQADGSWRDGFLAYTLSEAQGTARIGAQRTGRKVEVVPL
jgi:hypothetical protein